MATLSDDRARRFEDTNFTPVDRVIVRVQPELIFDHRWHNRRDLPLLAADLRDFSGPA